MTKRPDVRHRNRGRTPTRTDLDACNIFACPQCSPESIRHLERKSLTVAAIYRNFVLGHDYVITCPTPTSMDSSGCFIFACPRVQKARTQSPEALYIIVAAKMGKFVFPKKSRDLGPTPTRADPVRCSISACPIPLRRRTRSFDIMTIVAAANRGNFVF